ncbi:MAG: lectin-like protein [Verrucomicrobiota bacterium]
MAAFGVITGFVPFMLQAQPAGGLFTPNASFNSTNRLVSVSVFQWFSASGGQLTGPWRPVEGRSNWTGTTNFWRAQIKQMMAANFDMLYVHLIPSSESQRVNLFLALNQLRREGWNVPKVAPFLDPMITWNQQPLVDVSTAAGKDTFVNQYIRWFNQYYSVNQDPYADHYLAQINGRPILDTWHVKFNLSNFTSLTRADVEARLTNAFAGHRLFTNGVYLVTTALNDPTFAWADEKVPQFEINEYSRTVLWRGVRAAQLKGGYWDQNIRNPGDFLARAGGLPYSNAWSRVNRALLSRVYVESWNEYDEGTGIYAANIGPPYVKSGSGNTNTDVWSSANDPYEYIKTTARGAAAFNDWPERNARILWHNLPTRMRPGETRTATVIVRNEGDALWSEATRYRFGQQDFLDPVHFGPGRYLINDTQDDIPTFGGIFRGRPKTFTLSLQAPTAPGLYTNHWGMLQENVAWFGEEIVQQILVDPTSLYRGTNQAIDSTALLTNTINDHTEHSYVAANLPVGSYANCQITRTFAAPVKSLKLILVSGTADDVGYVGNILVTPNSTTQPCQLGQVTNEVDVTRAVSVNGNTASLTLRARDTCCCTTGWGEDTGSDRLNAKFQWEVELAPPAPFTPVFTNTANGRLYALLSPATWTWSERAATELGGHLATLRNQVEQDWVYNTFASYGGVNRFLWIGLNDVATEGRFVWSGGEPVNFTYWATGEPNNALTGEDFVTLYQPGNTQAGRWNDWSERVFDGSRSFNGVVELPASQGPPIILRQPFNRRVNLGVTTTFPIYATSSRPLRYQWRFNGTNIGWATNADLVLTNVQYDQAGVYSVRVSDALAAVESSNATLIVNHAPVAASQTISLDEDTALSPSR